MDFIIEQNRVYAEDEQGKLLAEITFPQVEDGVYNIEHTFVDDSLRGQGVAGKLMELAVDEIEKKKGKIAADCSYAKHWLEKNGKLRQGD